MPRKKTTQKTAVEEETVKPAEETAEEKNDVPNDVPGEIPEESAEETDSETETGEFVKNGKEKYFQSIGRRKESIARVRLYTKKSTDPVKEDGAAITVNGKDYTVYFNDSILRTIVESPLRKLKSLNRFKATTTVKGGGLSGQAAAIRHGLARALVQFDANFKKKLKKSGFLTRDSRAKERRKYGLKKARKAPQWSKR